MGTINTTLTRSEWAGYLEQLVPKFDGPEVTIEVIGEQYGDQIDVERLPLRAIAYDPKDDVVELALGGRDHRYPVVLRHFIPSPQEIAIEQHDAGRPEAIQIEQADGTRTLVRLFNPPMLSD